MKIAIITDTHFGARNDSLAFSAYFRKFYQNVFFPYLETNKIQTVFHLGDMFDRRKYLNYLSFFNAREYFFQPLYEKKCHMHALVGNHDIFYKNKNDINSLNLLLGDYRDCITIYEKAENIQMAGTDILLLPWIAPENFEHSIAKIEQSSSTIAMGHLELIGFQMYRDTIPSFVGLNRNHFQKFELVASGHFHHKSKQDNIMYLGSTYEMNWSDYDDSRGFHVFDTETHQFEYIQNPYRMFYKLHYDDSEELLTGDYSQLEGTYVKVIVRNKNNPYLFDSFIEQIEAAGVVDLQVVDDHLNMMLESDAEIINEAEDTVTMITKVVEQLDVKFDRNRFDALIKDLYIEALNKS